MNKNLFVVTVIFNPFNFQSRYRLYWNFKKHMEDSGVKLMTVEIAFGHQPFAVTTAENPMNLQLRTNQVLWMKERGLNLGFKHLFHVAPDCKYLGWFDADVEFFNKDFAAAITHKLSYTSVVQPFSYAVNLDSSDDFMWACPSSVKSFIDGRGYHQNPPLPPSYTYKGHPGLAWNITREAYENLGGLYERCAAGSADTVMSNAFKGDWSIYLPAPQTEAMNHSMAEFQKKADAVVHGSVGYTKGMLFHHWHGPSESRGYEKRWSILSYHRYDPYVDLVEDESGLFKWTGNKPDMEADIRLSLSSRNEDAK